MKKRRNKDMVMWIIVLLFFVDIGVRSYQVDIPSEGECQKIYKKYSKHIRKLVNLEDQVRKSTKISAMTDSKGNVKYYYLIGKEISIGTTSRVGFRNFRTLEDARKYVDKLRANDE